MITFPDRMRMSILIVALQPIVGTTKTVYRAGCCVRTGKTGAAIPTRSTR